MATTRVSSGSSVGADRYKRAIDDFVKAFAVQHDARAAVQLYAEDATLVDNSTGKKLQGRKAIEEWYSVWLRAFPDVTLEFYNVLGSGDRMAAEWISRGTHTGALKTQEGEIPATGKRVELRGCFIARLTHEGLYAEDSTYFDSASMLQQLGLM